MSEDYLVCADSECVSPNLEWVGHRNLVECITCGRVWEPTSKSRSYDRVKQRTGIKREELPEKGNVFAPRLLTRLNAGSR